MDSFKNYDRQGQQLENLVEELLKAKGAKYIRHAITAKKNTPEFDEQMKAQHKGDFELTRHGIYLECKNDLLFSTYGSMYFEVGEVRDETAPKDPKTIQAIGIAKHSYKAPTVMIHQLKEDKIAVYGARDFTDRLLMGVRNTGLSWNEKLEYKLKRLDKTNLALIWKGVDKWENPFMESAIVWANKDNLLKKIAQVAERELEAPSQNERILIELMDAHRGGDEWNVKGWGDYEFQISGEGSFGPTFRKVTDDDWAEAALSFVL